MGTSPVAQKVKNLPAMEETQVRSLGWEDPLKKGMTSHSSILAWRIPWTKEPGGLHSMGSQRVKHDWVPNTHTHTHTHTHFWYYLWCWEKSIMIPCFSEWEYLCLLFHFWTLLEILWCRPCKSSLTPLLILSLQWKLANFQLSEDFLCRLELA